MICNYCGKEAELVKGKVLYKYIPSIHNKNYWLCRPCEAYVGTHEGTDKPLGTLANSSLRKIRSKAHLSLDELWKRNYMTRTETYKWLASMLKINPNECHIGMFNEPQCLEVIRFCDSFVLSTFSMSYAKRNTDNI